MLNHDRELMPAQRMQPDSSQDAPLGGRKFKPLFNFQPGDDCFKNTCFIAAVVNLSSLLPRITEALSLRTRTWKEVILHVRTLPYDSGSGEKFGYKASHGGQHDAVELLGYLISGHTDSTVCIPERFTAMTCGHTWPTHVLRQEQFLPLSIPQPSDAPAVLLSETTVRYSVRQLLDHLMQPEQMENITCAVCGLNEQLVFNQSFLERPLHGVLVLRLLIFEEGGKSRAHVVPDACLDINGTIFDLCAVLEHRGSTVKSGHYVTLLRTPSGW